jgi:hypothetical protein
LRFLQSGLENLLPEAFTIVSGFTPSAISTGQLAQATTSHYGCGTIETLTPDSPVPRRFSVLTTSL